MRRGRRIAAAAAALALGVGAILVGRAVLGERTALAHADAQLAAPAPATSVGGGGAVAGGVLDTGAAWSARRAAARFERARTDTALALAVRDHVLAEQELEQLASAGPAARRSWAATLVAVLEADAAKLDRRHAKEHGERTIAALASAVAADPANEDAKRDLELLLTMQQRSRQKHRQEGASPPKPQRQKAEHKATASLAQIGSGW